MNKFQKTMLTINFMAWIFVAPFALLSLWLGLDNPISVVGSQSMYPTLKKGDILLIETCKIAYVNDIIVFRKSQINQVQEDIFIVHRVVKTLSINGILYYKTKGDNNAYPDFWSDYRGFDYTFEGMLSSRLLYAKVKYVIPYLGQLILFIQTTEGSTLLYLLILLFVVDELYLWRRKKKKMLATAT